MNPTTSCLPRLRRVFSPVASLLVLLSAASPLRAGSAHEVIVYSYVTADGELMPAPSAARAVSCALVVGGFQQLGVPDPDARAAAPAPEQVLPIVRRALKSAHLECVVRKPTAGELLVLCHWGQMRPETVPAAAGEAVNHREELQMLALVGGRVLARTVAAPERTAILEAARDERFFLIVSAYDAAAFVNGGAKRLLWRTQMSVPSRGLTSEHALPLLAAAGAALFGRETPMPRRITLEVSGKLRTAVK